MDIARMLNDNDVIATTEVTATMDNNTTMDDDATMDGNETMEHTAPRTYICKHCSALNEFSTKTGFENHYRLIHQFRVVVILLKDDGQKDPDNGTHHTLYIFENVFEIIVTLELVVTRTPGDSIPFQCPVCQKALNGARAVHQHVPGCDFKRRLANAAQLNPRPCPTLPDVYVKEPSCLLRPPLECKSIQK
jgi:hypothetical protein